MRLQHFTQINSLNLMISDSSSSKKKYAYFNVCKFRKINWDNLKNDRHLRESVWNEIFLHPKDDI
jgi:hypothetical protein